MAVNSILKSDPPLINELWHHMKGWYKTATNRPPPASQYNRWCWSDRHYIGEYPLSGWHTDGDWTLPNWWHHINSGKYCVGGAKTMETQARGALVMRVEHLQAWLAEKNRADRKYTKKWDKVVDIIQPAFKRGGGYSGVFISDSSPYY